MTHVRPGNREAAGPCVAPAEADPPQQPAEVKPSPAGALAQAPAPAQVKALAICHEALADAHAALDPEQHPDLFARLGRLLDCDGGACAEYQRERAK